MHGQYLHQFLWVLSRGCLFSLKSDLVEILRVLEGCEKIQESAAHSHMRQSGGKNRNALPERAFDFIHPFCLHGLLLR